MRLRKTDELDFRERTEPLVTPRGVLALVLVLLGIAWVVVYYVVVRADLGEDPGGPGWLSWMGSIERYNYLIGFGLFFLGLAVSAHPSTPMGRGRGVVVGMLGSFLLGLAWIVTFYIISDDISRVPVFDDLGQYNLVVGIAFMAVGFTFATRWE